MLDSTAAAVSHHKNDSKENTRAFLTGTNYRPIEDITSPSRTRLRHVRNQSRYFANDGLPSDRENEVRLPREGRKDQSDLTQQAGGDTRQWAHRNQQPASRVGENGGDHQSHTAAWSPSQRRAWYAEEQPQRSRRLPFPETHDDAHGESTNEHHISGSRYERRHTENEGRKGGWVDNKSKAYGVPPPQHLCTGGSGEERRGQSWGTRGPLTAGRSGYPGRAPEHWSYARQEGANAPRYPAREASDGVWRGGGRGSDDRGTRTGPPREHCGQQQYRHSGPGGPPGGAPTVGNELVSTKASTMHNPVDLGELARIQAKKDSYRRDLEAQVIGISSARAVGVNLQVAWYDSAGTQGPRLSSTTDYSYSSVILLPKLCLAK